MADVPRKEGSWLDTYLKNKQKKHRNLAKTPVPKERRQSLFSGPEFEFDDIPTGVSHG